MSGLGSQSQSRFPERELDSFHYKKILKNDFKIALSKTQKKIFALALLKEQSSSDLRRCRAPKMRARGPLRL